VSTAARDATSEPLALAPQRRHSPVEMRCPVLVDAVRSGDASGTMSDPEAGVAETFVARFGGAPAGVWRAPGRVNLIGEHTDYSDGLVMPFAIDREARVAAAPRTDGVVRCFSVELGEAPDAAVAELSPDAQRGWWSYVHGVVAELTAAGAAVTGCDLAIDSTVPVGAGLSSSAALECAVAVAVAGLAGAEASPTALALIAQRAENRFAGVPCGPMDQLAAMRGRAGHALLIDTRSLDVDPVPLSLPGVELVVIDTRVSHRLVEAAYAERRAQCERAAVALGVSSLRDVTFEALDRDAASLDPVLLRRARHVVTENARVLAAADALRMGDLEALGRAMADSHASLRDDYEVSCRELDLAVETATGLGGAARMTGAGFGGSAIAVIPVAAAGELGSALAMAFDAERLRRPALIPVRAADGASRLA
jgi:galactokinase